MTSPSRSRSPRPSLICRLTRPFCRSMAQKETLHRETIDGLNAEMDKLRREHAEVVTLSRDQASLLAASPASRRPAYFSFFTGIQYGWRARRPPQQAQSRRGQA